MQDYAIDGAAPSSGRGCDFLTVEEAAAVLRIGRTAAYEATRRYRATGGAEGLPVYKVGGTLRVPRHKLEEIGGGPIEVPVGDARRRSTEARPSVTDRPAAGTTSTRRPSNGDGATQPALPFGA